MISKNKCKSKNSVTVIFITELLEKKGPCSRVKKKTCFCCQFKNEIKIENDFYLSYCLPCSSVIMLLSVFELH